MTDELAEPDATRRLSITLLLCRIVTALIFGVYAYGTIIRPEMNADQLGKIYYIKGMPSGLMIGLGIIQLVISIMVLLGVFKTITRGILLALSLLACIMPTYLIGYITSTFGGVPHPAILYWSGFSLLACAYMIFQLRDEDTLLSMDWG